MQHHRRRNIEISHNTYHRYFMQPQPNYDLYPSLSRRMSNGYEHRPQPIARRSDPFNFATAVAKSSRFSGVNTTPQPVEQADAAVAADHQAPLPLSRNTTARQDWDCYPMVLRNVSTMTPMTFVCCACHIGYFPRYLTVFITGSKLWESRYARSLACYGALYYEFHILTTNFLLIIYFLSNTCQNIHSYCNYEKIKSPGSTSSHTRPPFPTADNLWRDPKSYYISFLLFKNKVAFTALCRLHSPTRPLPQLLMTREHDAFACRDRSVFHNP
jgi:hypothetical protein